MSPWSTITFDNSLPWTIVLLGQPCPWSIIFLNETFGQLPLLAIIPHLPNLLNLAIWPRHQTWQPKLSKPLTNDPMSYPDQWTSIDLNQDQTPPTPCHGFTNTLLVTSCGSPFKTKLFMTLRTHILWAQTYELAKWLPCHFVPHSWARLWGSWLPALAFLLKCIKCRRPCLSFN